MEITGKIIKVLEPRSGKSARTGNDWVVQQFVIETTEGTYPRRCVFDVFGQDKLAQMNIQVGETMTVSIDIDAHEYDGRWFNSIRAWKVDRNVAAPAAPDAAFPGAPAVAPAPAATSIPAPEAPAATAGDKIDDLPF